MKLFLDKDQRKLLKLRNQKRIESDQDEQKSIFVARKVLDKTKLLDLYVDNLLQKQIDKTDRKLLKITGLSEVTAILDENQLKQAKPVVVKR